MTEVKEMVVSACVNALETLASSQGVAKDKLNLRIDLKDLKEKPVYALFEESKFLCRCELKDIVRAAGGKGLNMLIGGYIRSIIKDIFSQTLTQLESKEYKDLFLLLFIKETDGKFEPNLAVYYKQEFIWSMLIADAIATPTK